MSSNIKEITMLFDTYGSLLTEIKQKYINLHYFEDMSLKEIANINNISRTAVHSSIISGIEELTKYEKKLNFLKNQHFRIQYILQIENLDLKEKLLDIEFGPNRRK